ncbi:MAG TPA: hypothetical protein VGM34_00910 [Chlamydiales bacterium]|jgi:hypothetical protein
MSAAASPTIQYIVATNSQGSQGSQSLSKSNSPLSASSKVTAVAMPLINLGGLGQRSSSACGIRPSTPSSGASTPKENSSGTFLSAIRFANKNGPASS